MKKLLTLLFLVAFTAWSSYGAVATDYCFTQSVVPSWTMSAPGPGATLVAPVGTALHNESYTDQPIGFHFVYNQVDYTTFGLNVDGYLKMGSAAVPVDDNQVLAGATNILSALNVNIEAQDISSSLSYWVDGIAGSRTLTVQWYRFNVERAFSANTNPVNFQIVLHEGTNVIEFKYGAVQGSATSGLQPAPQTAQVGINGAATSDYLIRTGPWAASTAAVANTAEFALTTATFPPANTVFTFTPPPPGAITPTPANLATCVATDAAGAMNLTWTLAALNVCGGIGATVTVDVYWATTQAGLATATPVNLPAATLTKAVTGLMPETMYWWKVVPKNTYGSGPAVDLSFTTVNKAPVVATTPSPANSATGINTTAQTLSWVAPISTTANEQAETFDVYFGQVLPGVANSANQVGTTFTTPTLLIFTNYSWRIDSRTAGCTPYTTTGTVWNFTTKNAVPGPVTTPAPIANATCVNGAAAVTLSWVPTPVSDVFGTPTGYRIYYGTIANPSTNLSDQVGTSRILAIGTLLPATTYYWKVVPYNVMGDGASSEWSFTTANQAPGIVTTPSPILNATGVNNIQPIVLSWAPITPATSTVGLTVTYDVRFGTDPTMVVYSTIASGITSPTASYTTNLILNTDYYWQVVAKNTNSCGNFSTPGPIWKFTTKNMPPCQVLNTGRTPANMSILQPQATVFNWTAPASSLTCGVATGYLLYISTDSLAVANQTAPVQYVSPGTTYTASPGLNYLTKYYWAVAATNAGDPTIDAPLAVGPGPLSTVWSFTVTPAPGSLSGLVLRNTGSNPIYNATLVATPVLPGGYPTLTVTSNSAGQYSFPGIFVMSYNISVTHSDYNSPVLLNGLAVGASTTQNFLMKRPGFIVSPLPSEKLIVSIRSGACSFTDVNKYFRVYNDGDGILHWNHALGSGSWLTLNTGGPWDLAASTSIADPTTFNTSALTPGLYTTNVTFTSTNPVITPWVVPVELTVVAGDPIVSATALTVTPNQVTGDIVVAWTGPAATSTGLVKFVLVKDGVPSDITPNATSTSYSVTLPVGLPVSVSAAHTYTVEAIYSGGYTSCIAGPVTATLYRPVLATSVANLSLTVNPGGSGNLSFNAQNTGNAASDLHITGITVGSFVSFNGTAPTFPVDVMGGNNMPVNLTFSAGTLAPGTYYQDVTVTSSNGNPLTIAVHCTLTVNNAYKLSGIVTNANGGAPIAGATVSFAGGMGAVVATTTNASGYYESLLVPGGTTAYSVTFAATGFTSQTKTVTVNGANATLNAALYRGAGCVNSIVNGYFFEQFKDVPYVTIGTGGTLLIPNNGLLDDQSFTDQPIGFNFLYNGGTFSTFGLNANGYVQLGSNNVNPLTGAVLANDANTLAALNADLVAIDGGTEIRYVLSGAAGSRTLTIQWYRFLVKGFADPNDLINFQIILKETSNVIEYRYGGVKGITAGIAQVGITGTTAADYMSRKTGAAGNEWGASVAGTNADAMALTQTIFPASNQVYRFTPNVPGLVTTPKVNNSTKFACIVNPVTLSWVYTGQSATAGKPDCNVKLYFGTAATPPLFDTLSSTTTSYSMLPTLLPATTYYWQIKTSNVIGAGITSPIWSFGTRQLAPGVATNPFPPDAGIDAVNIPAVTLKWKAPATSTAFGKAELYDIYFDDVNPPLVLVKTQADTLFTIASLDTNKVYYWKVVPKNLDTCGVDAYLLAANVPVWSFKTRQYVPGQVTPLTAPICATLMNSQKPTFTWTAPAVILPVYPAATKYRLVIATDAGFTVVTKDTTVVSTILSYTPIAYSLALNTVYYWKVYAGNALGWGIASATCSFTVTPGLGNLGGIVYHTNWTAPGTYDPTPGAVITAKPVNTGYPTVTTIAGFGGVYAFTGIYAVAYNVTASHPDYNSPSVTYTPTVTNGGTIAQDIYLTRPEIWVSPRLVVDIRPGACSFKDPANWLLVRNYADGILTWTHALDATATWLTLDKKIQPQTTAPWADGLGDQSNDTITYNSLGLVAGDKRTVNIIYTTSSPNVGTYTSKIDLNVVGTPIVPVSNMAGTLTQVNGIVNLTFDGPSSTVIGLTNITVKKNGTLFRTLTANATGKYTLTDIILPLTTDSVAVKYEAEAIYGGFYTSCPVSKTFVLYIPIRVAAATINVTLLKGTSGTVVYNVKNTGKPLSELYTSIKPAGFVTNVTPAFGITTGGSNSNFTIALTTGTKVVGTYTQTLVDSTNLGPRTIVVTMNVVLMNNISGTVVRGLTAIPTAGVVVTATMVSNPIYVYSTVTDEAGNYVMNVLGGNYTVKFTRPGFQDATYPGAVPGLTGNGDIIVNAQLWENLYTPNLNGVACATAVVNADDTQADVTWCVPTGLYEMLYDDGKAENFAAWDIAGNMNGVKFTPHGYPAKVTGARFFVGNGSFPAGGSFLGKTVDVSVYAAGTNGMPADPALSTVTVTVNNFGWVDVTGLNATIASGDFFIVVTQNSNAPNSVPIGVDETLPNAYMSYSHNVKAGLPWVLSPYQDFMIHAILSSPNPTVIPISGPELATPGKTGNGAESEIIGNRGLVSMTPAIAEPGMTGKQAIVTSPAGFDNTDAVKQYKLVRYPWTPGATATAAGTRGTGVELSNSLTSTTYTDGGSAWSALAAGWYVYGITAIYPNNGAAQESVEVYTNPVAHKLYTDITINVKSACAFVPAENAKVSLIQNMYPYKTLTATTTATGIALFDNADVVQGSYVMNVTKIGFDPFVTSFAVTGTTKSIDVVIEDHRYPVYSASIDPVTLVAKWDTAKVIFSQDFESPVTFGTSGTTWTRFHYADYVAGSGWYNYPNTWKISSNYSSPNFVIPAHTNYAAVNIDSAKLLGDPLYLADFLRTPYIDFSTGPKHVLSFDYFFTGAKGETAVLYCRISGTSWKAVASLPVGTTWQTAKVDVSNLSNGAVYQLSGVGGTPAQFGWMVLEKNNTAGNGDATGLALDNIKITEIVNPSLGFGVFLSSVGQVIVTHNNPYTLNPNLEPYGASDTLHIAALYCSGFSTRVSKQFTSLFLYPPTDLTATQNSSITVGGVDLKWTAPVLASPMGATGEVTLQYNVSEVISSGFSGDDASTPNTWRAAIRLTSAKLTGYYGTKNITKIMIGLADYAPTKVIAKIYKVTAGNKPVEANEVYSEDVTAKVTQGIWNTIVLATPVPIVAGFDYFVGYEISTAAGYPAGMTDSGTASSNNNWVWDKGFASVWYSLHDPVYFAHYGYTMANYNWCIKAVINNGSPTNLLSYNLYYGNATTPFANVLAPTTKKFDSGMMPGNYCYKVSALYDLTAYGLTGIGESTKNGPACVDVNYGYPLPFVENFTTGQFDVNQWVRCNNWIMDGQIGNPLPSAKFVGQDPALTGTALVPYTCALTSFFIDGTKITSTTPYKIWMEFDQKFVNKSSAGTEKLLVEVWDGTAWNKVNEDASTVSYDWKTVKLDITDLAKGKVFKVRFNATGVNSANIYSWAVDNINIHVVFTLAAPTAFDVKSYNTPKNDNKLTWTAPAGGGVLSYNIYRRAYSVYPAGANTAGGTWTKIESGVTALEYWDMNLSNLITNCYEYQVTAVYPEGESLPSATGWQCIFVSNNPLTQDAVKVYPNPATDFVKMDLTKSVVKIDVYNSLGAVVATKNVQGSTTYTLNTREFAAGAYSVKFTNASGESFSRKFIVSKSNNN